MEILPKSDHVNISQNISMHIVKGIQIDLYIALYTVHLWRYRGGYPALTEVMNKLKNNKVENTFK